MITQRARVLIVGSLFVISVYFLLPIWWLIVATTKDTGDLFTTNGFWFTRWHLLDNLGRLFSVNDGAYLQWIANTLVYAGIGGVVSTIVSTTAGYALAKYRFKGRELIFNIMLGAVLIPQVLLAFPLFLLFTKIGLVNTYWAVLAPSIASPFGVYLARVYAASAMPDELIDAGRIDGAGDVKIFFTIAMRVMSPAMVTIFLFQFVAIWNNQLLPLYMLQDDKLWPVTLGLSYWSSIHDQPIWTNLAIVGSAISVIPLVIAFLSLQRFWRSGLTAGSVK